MKKLYYIIALFVSCSGNVDNKSNIINCPEINPLKVTKEVAVLEEYIDTMEVIDINRGKEYFNIDNAKKIIVLDNGEIIFLMKEIVKFDSKGNYIQTYGDTGRGNGEYLRICDICLNFDKTELWALNHINQVLKYNLHSGKYIGTFEINYHEAKIAGTCDGLIPSNDNGFYLVSLNKPKAEKIDYDYPFLTAFDKNGACIKNLLQSRDFNLNYPYSSYVTYSSGKYLIRPQENENICYMIEKGKVSPFIKIHFEDKNIEPLFAFKDGGNPFSKLQEILESDSYKHIMNIQLTEKYLFFSTLRPHSSQENFLINIEELSGIRWSHKREDTYPLFIKGSDKDYFYGTYIYFKEHDNISANESPLINYIVKRIDKSREGEPILLKIKFK